jgi:hypothetical protein
MVWWYGNVVPGKAKSETSGLAVQLSLGYHYQLATVFVLDDFPTF